MVISLKGVTKEYRKGVIALDNISFDFCKGKLYGIVGHSGSGKTTLLNMIGALDKPTQGEIDIFQKNVLTATSNERTNIRRDKIGFVFQSYMLHPRLKAYENVMLPMLSTEKSFCECKKRAIELLQELGLENRIEHFPTQLSGGEQQRVSIARALSNSPAILLADEPTGNLDEENEIIVLKKLRNLSENGYCVIVVSHNSRLAEFADCIITMEGGRICDAKQQ